MQRLHRRHHHCRNWSPPKSGAPSDQGPRKKLSDPLFGVRLKLSDPNPSRPGQARAGHHRPCHFAAHSIPLVAASVAGCRLPCLERLARRRRRQPRRSGRRNRFPLPKQGCRSQRAGPGYLVLAQDRSDVRSTLYMLRISCIRQAQCRVGMAAYPLHRRPSPHSMARVVFIFLYFSFPMGM